MNNDIMSNFKSRLNTLFSRKTQTDENNETVFSLLKERNMELAFAVMQDNKTEINFNSLNENGNTFAHELAKNQFIYNDKNHTLETNQKLKDAFRFLRENGADFTIQNKEGDTPFHIASSHGNEILFSYIDDESRLSANGKFDDSHVKLSHIIDYGSFLDIQNNKGQTPLHLVDVDHNIAKQILSLGANPDIQDNNGNTPLHCTWSEDVKEVLLDAKANPNILNNNNERPLDHEIANFWSLTGAENKVQGTKDASETVLTMELLLKHGAKTDFPLFAGSLNKQLDDGDLEHNKSMLHYAVQNKYSNTVQFLLENGANPDIQDNNGNTPLHLLSSDHTNYYLAGDNEATEKSTKAIFNTLINSGAHLAIKNKQGQTPQEKAEHDNSTSVMQAFATREKHQIESSIKSHKNDDFEKQFDAAMSKRTTQQTTTKYKI